MSMPTSTELSHDCYAIISQLELALAPFRDGGMAFHRGDEAITIEIVAQLAVRLSDLRVTIGALIAGSGNSAAVRTEAASAQPDRRWSAGARSTAPTLSILGRRGDNLRPAGAAEARRPQRVPVSARRGTGRGSLRLFK
jgi:hypothetical protein